MKKFINYQVFLLLTLFLIVLILFGALLRHHYIGAERFKNLQKIAVFFAEVPSNIKFIIKNRTLEGNIIPPINENIYNDKKIFDKKLTIQKRDELLVLSRQDGDLNRSIVEIRDLNTFDVLHTYKPNIDEIYNKIDFTREEFNYWKKIYGVDRFRMVHPAIALNGDLIFQSPSPLIKIDLSGKIIWVKDKDIYHHSIELDLDENIYVASHKDPFSEKVSKFVGKKSNGNKRIFLDDTINILDQNGNEIFSKSVSDILIEHGLVHRIFASESFVTDPIHLNDIQPVLKDGPYFKKGDLFLSLRNLNMIILYRPKTNKIIKIIEGGFLNQHDVDIIDEKTISIYNNNVYINYKQKKVDGNNEILFYDFESNLFSKRFENTFKKLKINTVHSGLADFLKDGSAIIEDNNNGRIFYLNNEGEVIWEFNNLNSNKQLYDLWWSRVIGPEKSRKIRQILKN